MIRTLAGGALLIGLVLLGMVAQAGAYLLALPSPAPHAGPIAGDHTSQARGQHAVGRLQASTDDAPLAMTIWYPADVDDSAGRLDYSLGINVFGPDAPLALGTNRGLASAEARFDLAAGPYPLVILSHGFAIAPSSYAWLAEHLAANGMVVVAPHHRESLDPGGLWRSSMDRPSDVLAVLSWVDARVDDDAEFRRLVDSQAVAVVGHSYGGYTALAAAGARLDTAAFERTCRTAEPLALLCDAILPRVADMAGLAGLEAVPSSLWPSVADPRVDAIVSFAGDAAVFGRSGLAEVSVPMMAIGGTADVDTPYGWGTEFAYEHVSSARKVEIGFEDGSHMLFAAGCDRARRILNLVSLGLCSDVGWDRSAAHDLVKEYATAFLAAELGRDQSASRRLAPGGPLPDGITYRAEGY